MTTMCTKKGCPCYKEGKCKSAEKVKAWFKKPIQERIMDAIKDGEERGFEPETILESIKLVIQFDL